MFPCFVVQMSGKSYTSTVAIQAKHTVWISLYAKVVHYGWAAVNIIGCYRGNDCAYISTYRLTNRDNVQIILAH